MKPDLTTHAEKPERVTGCLPILCCRWPAYSSGCPDGFGGNCVQGTSSWHCRFVGAPLRYDAGVADFSVFLLIPLFGPHAVEALNTAIECHRRPLGTTWEVFARDARSGSLATMCCFSPTAFFLGAVILRLFTYGGGRSWMNKPTKIECITQKCR